MRKSARRILVGCAGFAALQAASASAASNRTWVSSTGAGVTCSRAAPCATFQDAHDNTNFGGEINCVDSADFGSVNINKSISIICDNAPGRVLATVSAAISVSASASDVIVLSGLDLNGFQSGNVGVLIQGATGKVQIRNSTVQRFSIAGIHWVGTGSSQLVITDSSVHDNSVNIRFDVNQTAASALNAHLTNVRVANGNTGVRVLSSNGAIGVNANLRDCVITGAAIAGLQLQGTSYTVATVLNTQMTGNFGPALSAIGTAGTSIIRAGNSSILVNTTGIQTSGIGQVLSFGDNNVNGNGAGETFSGALLAKK